MVIPTWVKEYAREYAAEVGFDILANEGQGAWFMVQDNGYHGEAFDYLPPAYYVLNDDGIDAAVEEWHKDDFPFGLHAWLGMTFEEYKDWVDGGCKCSGS